MSADAWAVARPDGHEVTTDPARLDFAATHAAVADSFWCRNIPQEDFRRALEHSIPFGLYLPNGAQAGFCRAMSDTAVFGYLTDFIVFEGFRGEGLGSWLAECVLSHPDLQGLRRIHLATRDRQEFFARYGFRLDAQPGMQMDIVQAPELLWPAPG